jgi:hypothetical protein
MIIFGLGTIMYTMYARRILCISTHVVKTGLQAQADHVHACPPVQ